MTPAHTRRYIHFALLINLLIFVLLLFDTTYPDTSTKQLGVVRSWLEKQEIVGVGLGEARNQCSFCEGNATLCGIYGCIGAGIWIGLSDNHGSPERPGHLLCRDEGTDDYRERKLATAIGYEGSNLRLRRFLAKAATGEGFTVAVVGGSGHGLGGDEMNGPLNMNRVVFDHLDQLFPGRAGQEAILGRGGEGRNGFVNGALGGMGSDYFSMCFAEHIVREADLVLVDLSINDQLNLNNMGTYEMLIRGLLDLPNQPAIINMQIMALKFDTIAFGGDVHEGVSQFYDIPTISMRNVLLNDALNSVNFVRELFKHVGSDKDLKEDMSDIDTRHLSAEGHRKMGDLVNAYISWQTCEMKRDMEDDDIIDEVYPIPPLPRKYDPHLKVPKLQPACFSMNAEKSKLVAAHSEGWEEWNWKAKRYLRATEPGSTIHFNFTTALGEVQLHYLRSATFGLGSLRCWVDEDKDRSVVLEGYWNVNINIGKGMKIRSDLSPGEHQLHCELLKETKDPNGGTEFRLISLMTI